MMKILFSILIRKTYSNLILFKPLLINLSLWQKQAIFWSNWNKISLPLSKQQVGPRENSQSVNIYITYYTISILYVKPRNFGFPVSRQTGRVRRFRRKYVFLKI